MHGPNAPPRRHTNSPGPLFPPRPPSLSMPCGSPTDVDTRPCPPGIETPPPPPPRAAPSRTPPAPLPHERSAGRWWATARRTAAAASASPPPPWGRWGWEAVEGGRRRGFPPLRRHPPAALRKRGRQSGSGTAVPYNSKKKVFRSSPTARFHNRTTMNPLRDLFAPWHSMRSSSRLPRWFPSPPPRSVGWGWGGGGFPVRCSTMRRGGLWSSMAVTTTFPLRPDATRTPAPPPPPFPLRLPRPPPPFRVRVSGRVAPPPMGPTAARQPPPPGGGPAGPPATASPIPPVGPPPPPLPPPTRAKTTPLKKTGKKAAGRRGPGPALPPHTSLKKRCDVAPWRRGSVGTGG